MELRRVYRWSENSSTHWFTSRPTTLTAPFRCVLVFRWRTWSWVAFHLSSLRYKSIHQFSIFLISQQTCLIICWSTFPCCDRDWSIFNASYVCNFVHNNDIFHICGIPVRFLWFTCNKEVLCSILCSLFNFIQKVKHRERTFEEEMGMIKVYLTDFSWFAYRSRHSMALFWIKAISIFVLASLTLRKSAKWGDESSYSRHCALRWLYHAAQLRLQILHKTLWKTEIIKMKY